MSASEIFLPASETFFPEKIEKRKKPKKLIRQNPENWYKKIGDTLLKMNFSYNESKQCCIYHFKCRVYMNRNTYKQLYEEDKSTLINRIISDVKDILDNMMIVNNDYSHDWKLQDYISIVKNITNPKFSYEPKEITSEMKHDIPQ